MSLNLEALDVAALPSIPVPGGLPHLPKGAGVYFLWQAGRLAGIAAVASLRAECADLSADQAARLSWLELPEEFDPLELLAAACRWRFSSPPA